MGMIKRNVIFVSRVIIGFVISVAISEEVVVAGVCVCGNVGVVVHANLAGGIGGFSGDSKLSLSSFSAHRAPFAHQCLIIFVDKCTCVALPRGDIVGYGRVHHE